MKTCINSPWVLSLSTIVFLLSPLCKGHEAPQADQNLKAIVDLEETLDQSSPAQFAANTFRDFFQARDPNIKDRYQDQESKTSKFQKTFINYIKTKYNRRNYANALSQDCTDILQFIDVSNEMSLSADTVYVGIRLFYNKYKATELIDDTVILQLLENIPPALERHFASEQESRDSYDLAYAKKHLESLLLAKFTDHLADFQASPDTFLSSLANELAQYYQQEMSRIKRQHHRIETLERLRHVVIRFFDTALGKTIWNPKGQDNIWKSFVSIAQGLQLLANHSVINHMDDLDDLLWTLNHRFCFFLDLAGAALPTTFYKQVEHDLENRSVFFLEFKEQDDGIATKKEILAEYLIQAKARAIAYEKKGIITTPM